MKNNLMLFTLVLVVGFLAIGCSAEVDYTMEDMDEEYTDDIMQDTVAEDTDAESSEELSIDCDGLTGHEAAECFTELAKYEQDHTLCEALPHELASGCYLGMAIELNDEEICNYVSDDEVMIESCKGTVRVSGQATPGSDAEQGSFEDCQNYAQQDGMMAAACYMELAKAEKDYEYCEYIVGASNNAQRLHCYANVAFELDDVSVCDHATNPYAAYETDPVQGCLEYFELLPLDY